MKNNVRIPATVAGSLAVAALVAGCGAGSDLSQPGSASTTTIKAPPDACTVLTRDELAAVLGASTAAGVPTKQPGGLGSDCDWHAGAGRTITVAVRRGALAYQPERWIKGEPKPLDGLPLPSYYFNDGLAIKVAWVHGDVSVQLSAYTGKGPAVADLARLADSRLS